MSGEFVGVAEMVRLQEAQLASFRAWAAEGNWDAFHFEHYDWWAFPVDRESKFGLRYAVFENEIAALLAVGGYAERLDELLKLGLLAWGWDLAERAFVPLPGPDQRWAHHPIRLHKMGRAAQLFGRREAFASAALFAAALASRGTSLRAGALDCGAVFRASAV